MNKKKTKTVNLDLVGINSNAYAIMGAFSQQARREGWSEEEIKEVLKEAKSDNYDHLLATISELCVPTDDINDEE